MTHGNVPELGATIDGASVTVGARTWTWTYVPWGRHLDDRNWPEGDDEYVSTIQEISVPTRSTDIGSGRARSRPFMEVHVWWEDHDAEAMDVFERRVDEAIVALVRASEKSIGQATYTQFRGGRTIHEMEKQLLIYHRILSFEADFFEGY